MAPPTKSNVAKFGTFTGVFTPTLLTILGVILYVRLGWVVGNAGLLGAYLVMGLAMIITLCTGLSLSSIATNRRLGAGGPYAIISKALGFEVGGSIGLPLYLSRPLGVAMYIFGFREGWLWVFPAHDPLVIDLVVFVALFGLAYLSANLAFRVQFVIMVVIVASSLAIVLSPVTLAPRAEITWWGDFRGFPERGFGGIDFWAVFAVFFPATTGILAGANMSGDLKDPRRSIPRGTLWAIVLSSIIYFALAWWAARAGSPEELTENYNLLIDRSLFPPVVLAGLLGATFSSALASAVGGPRILMAMAHNKLLPKSDWLGCQTSRGEPRHAVLVTAILSLGCLMVRDLNAIAPLVTMFFLLTYLMINVVLLIEGSLKLVSFRPTLVVPRVVPLIGAVGCVFCMFIVSPIFGIVAVATVVATYVYIQRRGLPSKGDDVRSGMLVALADWAATRITVHGVESVRAWKPNLLVPFEDPEQIRGEFAFIADLCRPEGSVKLLGLATEQDVATLQPRVQKLHDNFTHKKLFSSYSIIDSAGFTEGILVGLQALQSAFFRPNLLFLTLPEKTERHAEFGKVIVEARRTGVGVLFLGLHPKTGLGQRAVINLWMRAQPERGWDPEVAFDENNLDLTLLTGFRLARFWNAKLNLITVVDDEAQTDDAKAFLEEIIDVARLPDSCSPVVMVGGFEQCVREAPQSDIDIMGLQPDPDFPWMLRVIELTRSSCLFVGDSGHESARA
jgi:solute carrier family 12 sodium/potassium/chloride transporter 2